MTNLNVEQLQKWYRKQLQKKSVEFLKQAERSYKIVERALQDVGEFVKAFKDEEIEDTDGIAARFALKVKEIVDNFNVDKNITYEGTELMQGEIQRFIQELWGAGARWIKRLDKRYKTTIKSLDTAMKELSKEMKKIGKLLYDFSWVKDLERIGGRIDTLHDLTFSKEIFEEQIHTVRSKIESAEKYHNTTKKAYDDFTETSNVAELLNLDEQAEHISSMLKMKMNPLKKQVKKFLQSDTGVRIGPAGQKALIDYFENPFYAIAEDADGYPGLIEGLSGLQQALETKKLSLKDRLTRRAIEEITLIKNGGLQKFQDQAKDIQVKRHTYAGSDVYTQSANLEANLTEAKKNLDYHKNDLLRIRDDLQRQIGKVDEFKVRIEAEILESFSEKITIELEVSLKPLVALCSIE